MSTERQINALVLSKLKEWRRRLLDVSHGPLLDLQARGRPLAVARPDCATVYDRIVLSEETLRIYLPSKAQLALLDGDEALAGVMPEDGEASASEVPLRPDEVRLAVDARKLASVMYRLRLRARTVLEEQGVNTLHLTFGELQWREEGSRSVLRSPLVMVPVILERDSTLHPYALRLNQEEEVVLNPVLSERLQKQFKVTWTLPDSQDTPGLQTYLAAVRQAIPHAADWKVAGTCHLGTFSFHKLALLSDLTDNQERIVKHPVVRALCGIAGAMPDVAGVPGEDELDDAVPPVDTFHFLDADSSQLEAITAVSRGMSLVVQGPPGTGKSQTIANIIAESLARQKRVLFVSDKQAARDVVLRRLAEHGLDEFCLSLDGGKADKKAVVEQLARAFHEAQSSAPTSAEATALTELHRTRVALNAYVRALHDSQTGLAISAFQGHAEVARRSGYPDLACSIPDVATRDQSGLTEDLDLIEAAADLGHVLLSARAHPWWGTRIGEFTLKTQEELRAQLTTLLSTLTEVHQELTGFEREWGFEAPGGVPGLQWAIPLLRLLLANPRPPRDWLLRQGLPAFWEAQCLAMADASDTYHDLRDRLLAQYDEQVLSLDAAGLLGRLAGQPAAALHLLEPGSKTPEDFACEQREALVQAAGGALAAIGSVQSILDQCRATLGAETELSPHGARRALKLLEAMASEPRPLSAWLDRREALDASSLVSEATRRSDAWESGSAEILGRFSEQVLAEAPGLAERFRTKYGGISRYLRPGYRKDLTRMRELLLVPGGLSRREAAELAKRAEEVASARLWLASHDAELTARFGQHPLYDGLATDWSALQASITTTRAVCDWFGEKGIQEATAAVLLGKKGPVPLRDWAQELGDSLRSLERSMVALRSLAPSLASFGDHAPLTEMGEGIGLLLGGLSDFYRIVDEVAAVVLPGMALQPTELVQGLRRAAEVTGREVELDKQSEGLLSALGEHYHGYRTDWRGLATAAQWCAQVLRALEPGAATTGFADRLSKPGERKPRPEWTEVEKLELLTERLRSGLEWLEAVFVPDALQADGTYLKDVRLDSLQEWVRRRLESVGRLEEWLDATAAAQRCTQAGLGPFLVEVTERRIQPDQWRDAYLKRFYQLWLDERYGQDEALASFRGAAHEKRIDRFRELDKKSLRVALKRVRQSILQARPRLDAVTGNAVSPLSEVGILLRETQKRRRLKPVRRLLREIPHLLQVLKPCLLMSPLAVSQYLDPKVTQFDLVVFDEASQVLPEDAIASVYRGSQLVVAGDTKQLPPTTFFQSGSTLDMWDPEDEEPPESLLDQCLAVNFPQKRLRWHYRSRHEALIAFSNVNYYDGTLVTFPSPDEIDGRNVIQFVHVPDGVYERGRGRVNRTEARRVVDLMIEHARIAPHKSLGVVAFNAEQRLAILQELETARTKNPDLEEFFSVDRREPVFVKSLELVQGDERDVVFFSIGYGRDSDGRLIANFGPVNKLGGERRLNVAVTRAREHVKVVCSFLPDELQLPEKASRGAQHLRDYLRLAALGTGTLPKTPAVTTGPDLYDSAFEESVAEALRGEGLQVVTQVGCSGYRIDMAIVDPDAPGRYILGVECDGASYHRSPCARDRDRLRQEVLENVGWRIHRIWSRDWIRDPEREMGAVLAAVAAARREGPRAPGQRRPPGGPAPPDGPRRSVGTPVSTVSGDGLGKVAISPVTPYRYAEVPAECRARSQKTAPTLSADDLIVRREWLAGLVVKCVEVESPVHTERITEFVGQCLGVRRVGSRIAEHVEAAIGRAYYSKSIVLRDGFAWSPKMQRQQVPVRTPPPGEAQRSIEHIDLAEIGQAACLVLQDNVSLPIADAARETAKRLGYERTGRLIADRVEQAISVLVTEGRAQLAEGRVSLPPRATSV